MKNLLFALGAIFCFLHIAQGQQISKTHDLAFTEIDSKVLGEKRRVVVHLPLNYTKETTKKYPVMYVLDASKLDFDVADRLFTLSSAGIAPESIVVGILNVKNGRERDLTPPFMQTETEDASSPLGKADVFKKFVGSELMPLIDSTYRTTGYNTITGHSRAGLFVLYALLDEPEMFDAYFSYSVPAWRFDNILIKRIEEKLKKSRLRSKTYLFFSVGDSENANIKASFDAMEKMFRKVKPINLRWESQMTPLADHQSNPVFSIGRGLSKWASSQRK